MSCAFVTGIAGFVGSHLCDRLLAAGVRVAGVDALDSLGRDGITYQHADIMDSSSLAEMMAALQPDFVYHLAAVSFPPDADNSPRHALDINIMGTVSVLDAVRRACPRAVTLVVGSSKVYDNAREDVDELAPVNPVGFYGISKCAGELIGNQYVRQFSMDVRFTRSFNHTGPGQSPRFVCSDWARQIALVNAGKQEPVITVGDIDVEIDFTDVRDVVRAYEAIVANGTAGRVYNVCSGRTVSLRHVLDRLLARARVPVAILTASTKLRGHTPVRRMVGNAGRLQTETGWTPAIPLEQTLDDLCAGWEQSIA